MERVAPDIWILPADKSPTGMDVKFITPSPERTAQGLVRLAELAPATPIPTKDSVEAGAA